ncbi:MAG: hypothetical protein ACPG49_14555, partial [Chitinophagales bacterium]
MLNKGKITSRLLPSSWEYSPFEGGKGDVMLSMTKIKMVIVFCIAEFIQRLSRVCHRMNSTIQMKSTLCFLLLFGLNLVQIKAQSPHGESFKVDCATCH